MASLNPYIQSSFNNTITQSVAINSTISVTNFYGAPESNVISKVKNLWGNLLRLTDQKKVTIKDPVDPDIEKILHLIWRNLSSKDKINCTLVCRSFNRIISEMDHFHINANFISKFLYIPTLSRNYSTVKFQHYQCNNLDPLISAMLDQLKTTLINFTLDDCQFEMLTLFEILNKLSALKSLQLNMILEMKQRIMLPAESVPKLEQLKVLKVKVNDKMLKEILVMLSSAANLESISLFDAKFDFDVIDYLIKYKRLKSLSLTKCILETPSYMSNLNALHFDSTAKVQPEDYKKFECLEQLQELKLMEVNDELLRILETKVADQITDFQIIFNGAQELDVRCFITIVCIIYDVFRAMSFPKDFNILFGNYKTFRRKTKHPPIAREVPQFIKKDIEYYFTDSDQFNKTKMCSFKIIPITVCGTVIEGSKPETYEQLTSCEPFQINQNGMSIEQCSNGCEDYMARILVHVHKNRRNIINYLKDFWKELR